MGGRGSSEEGEIMEGGGGDLKATTLPNSHGKGVDRQNRNRGRYSRSPGSDRSHRNDNRNPSPRGFKRPRDDRDSYQHRGRGSGGDPRNFRVHYEDSRDDRRSRQYDDLDRPTSRGGSSRYGDQGGQRGYNRHENRDRHYDDRDRGRGYADKRPRTRSRSPLPDRGRGRQDRGRRDYPGSDRRLNREQAESIQYNTHHDNKPRDDFPKRGPAAVHRNAPKDFAKSAQGVAVENGHTGSTLVTRERTDPPPPPEEDYEEEEHDVEAEIERRRRRREEILRKSRASTPMHLLALADKTAVSTPGNSTQPTTPHHTDVNTPKSSVASPAMSPALGQDGLTPDGMDLANDQDLSNAHIEQKTANDEDGPSAAEYDPTADMQEDERRDELRHGTVGFHGEEREPKAAAEPEQPATEKTSDEAAEDDEFDMFAEEIDEEKYVAPKAAAQAAAAAKDQARNPLAPPAGGILEGDDKEGYYKIRPGEVVNGRYQIQSSLGKGMFSGVVRGLDINTKELVAIKIMRNNDALKKGGLTEIAILQKLNAADPDDKKHIVRFERSYEHLGHLCMVFESLSMNLREVLKKFGNNVGIKLSAVRIYAYQIFVALAHMRKCTIIHADLKPDNILVNEARNRLKICDLGTAIDRSDAATAHNEITPYLVSRFYRAPEIILGIPYDYAADMWSIGCTLYELYTGKILFTGGSNNQMLKAMMEIRGKMSSKLYRRGELWRLHFDDMGSFISQERDEFGKPTIRVIPVIKPARDLQKRLLSTSTGMSEDETRELHLFYDLLDKCLNLNPDKRLLPADALKHPFFTAKSHSSATKPSKR